MSCEEISLSLRGKGFIGLIGHGHIPDKKKHHFMLSQEWYIPCLAKPLR
jgi:hypothetical protein